MSNFIHVYAMCGVAFSGKSALARRIACKLSIPVISLDEINDERGLCGGDGLSSAEWEKTSAIAMERLRQFLRGRQSVVVDDTFSHRFLRDRCATVADECRAGFTIVFVDTPMSEIRRRRAHNDQAPTRPSIRDDVFEAHYANFEFPGDDEPVVRVRADFDIDAWLAEIQRRSLQTNGRST